MNVRAYMKDHVLVLDGGMGIYENGDKIVAVYLCRIGAEVDFVQGQGIYENISKEVF